MVSTRHPASYSIWHDAGLSVRGRQEIRMNRHTRTFRNAAAFSGLMATGAIVGSCTRADGAFAVLGCAMACQTAAMLAVWISGSDARAWKRGRTLAACLPSYAAAATAFGIALDRGLTGRHAVDFVVMAAILILQGRMFAAHISGAGGSRSARVDHSAGPVPCVARSAHSMRRDL